MGVGAAQFHCSAMTLYTEGSSQCQRTHVMSNTSSSCASGALSTAAAAAAGGGDDGDTPHHHPAAAARCDTYQGLGDAVLLLCYPAVVSLTKDLVSVTS